MGRKKKNNKNKGNNKKVTNSNNKNGTSTSATDNDAKQITNEIEHKSTDCVKVDNGNSAETLEINAKPDLSTEDNVSIQESGVGRRSLRDKYELQKSNSSSEGSVSSSVERELVQEIENVLEKSDSGTKDTVIPKLNLNFLDESGTDLSQAVRSLDNTVISVSGDEKQVKQNEKHGGLTYSDIKTQNITPQQEDKESGIGTFACSSNTDGAQVEGKVSPPSSDLLDRPDSRLNSPEDDIGDRPESRLDCPDEINQPETRLIYPDEINPQDSRLDYPDEINRPESRLDYPDEINRPESRLDYPEDDISDQLENRLDFPDDISDGLESRLNLSEDDRDIVTRPESRIRFYDSQTSVDDFRQEIQLTAINEGADRVVSYESDLSSQFRNTPSPGAGTEFITVSAYVSEPNLATFLRNQSPSIVEDTSDDGYNKQMYSCESTPRSYADLTSNGACLEIISAKCNLQNENTERPQHNDRYVTVREYDLDTSIDALPVCNVRFTNQGTSLFDEINASEEDLHENSGKVTVKGLTDQDQPPSSNIAQNFIHLDTVKLKHIENVSDVGSALESARTAASKDSSMKEDDNLSNPESITDYGPSPSEGSKTLSFDQNSDDGSVIERMVFHMQSAPALLEAQQLEQNYREFMSDSDVSQGEVQPYSIENIAYENKPVSSSSANIYEQLSQVEYKICYDMNEEQAEHPGSVYVSAIDDEVKGDLDAGFILEGSVDDITETSHDVEVMQDVDDIIQDREHVSMVLSNLNQEIERLSNENKHLYGEMSIYRNSSKQYKGKAESMDGYIKKLRTHVKSLEVQLADINSQRQNIKNSYTMTDQVLMLNTSSQVEPVTYDGHMQTEVLTGNKGCQIGDYAVDNHFHFRDCGTSTDDLLQQSTNNLGGSTASLSRPTSSVSPIRVRAEMEGDERKRSSMKASAMLDRLIQQMSNIAGRDEAADDTEEDPETPEKWRRLSMTPISTEPEVLQLQKSLASATVEFDSIDTKYKNRERDIVKNTEELKIELKDTVTALEKSKEECESWQMKYEGDRTEIQVLREKLAVMEKDFMLAQMDKERLEEEANKAKVKVSEVKMPDTDKGSVKEVLEQKVSQLEQERNTLQEEFSTLQKNQNTDVEKLQEVESALQKAEEERNEYENEIRLVREEYQTLQRAVQSMEKAFYLKSDETTTDPKKISLLAETRIEELKKHVFESKPVKAKSTESLVSNNSSGGSLHDDIIQQSELVLHVLRQSGDLQDEEARKKEQLVHWQQVKSSIEDKLNGKDNEVSNQSIQLIEDDQKSSSVDISGCKGQEVKNQLSELVSAISSDFGVKINITVEDQQDQTTENAEDNSKGSKKMELDVLTQDYEEMRKRRLAMLVQSYTGQRDRQRLNNKTYESSLKEQKPEVKGNPLFTKSLDPREWSRNEVVKEKPSFSSPIHNPNYFSSSSRPLQSSYLGTDAVLRQSQEDLNNLLTSKTPVKVPRVCTGGSHGSRSQNIFTTANGSESNSPYSYRMRKDIYPHKKYNLSTDQFYDKAKEQEEKFYGENSDYEYSRTEELTHNADRFYDDPYDSNYTDDRRISYGELSDSSYLDDPYYYGQDSYSGGTLDKKEAVVKLRAKLLKQKRLAAKEKARRSPSPMYELNEQYGNKGSLQNDNESLEEFSKSWSPQTWSEGSKSDLNSIKKSIRDYSAHLRNKYSGHDVQSKEDDATFWNGSTSPTAVRKSHGNEVYEPSEYSSLYQSATKFNTSITPDDYGTSQLTDVDFVGAHHDSNKYSAKPKETAKYTNPDRTDEGKVKYPQSSKQSSNQYLVDKYIDGKNRDVTAVKRERSTSPTRHTSSHLYSQSINKAALASSEFKTLESKTYNNFKAEPANSSVLNTRSTILSETSPTYSMDNYQSKSLKTRDAANPETNLNSKPNTLSYNSYSMSGPSSRSKPDKTVLKTTDYSTDRSKYTSYTKSDNAKYDGSKWAYTRDIGTVESDTKLKTLPQENNWQNDELDVFKGLTSKKREKSTERAEKQVFVAYQEKSTPFDLNDREYRNQKDRYDVKFIEKADESNKENIAKYKDNAQLKYVHTDKDIYRREMEQTRQNRYGSDYTHGHQNLEKYSHTTKYSPNVPVPEENFYREKDNMTDALKEIVLKDYEHVDRHLRRDKINGKSNSNFDSYNSTKIDRKYDDSHKPVSQTSFNDSSHHYARKMDYKSVDQVNDKDHLKGKNYQSGIERNDNTDGYLRSKVYESPSHRNETDVYIRNNEYKTTSQMKDKSLYTKTKGYESTNFRDESDAYSRNTGYETAGQRKEPGKYTGIKDYGSAGQNYETSSYNRNKNYETGTTSLDKTKSYGDDTTYSKYTDNISDLGQTSNYPKSKVSYEQLSDDRMLNDTKTFNSDFNDRYKTDHSYKIKSSQNYNSAVGSSSLSSKPDVRPKSPIDKYVTHRDSSHTYRTKSTSYNDPKDAQFNATTTRMKSDVSQYQSNDLSKPVYASSKVSPNHTSKYTQSKDSYSPGKKPELSKEYIESINKASASLDSHMLEIKQRSSSITDDRRILPDDASSVTGSSVSDADFVVVSSGDIVRRKSKSAKKLDKARNTQLQLRSYGDSYKEYEDDDFEGQDKSEVKVSLDGFQDYDITTAGNNPDWGEPRRHFGLRDSYDDSSELHWREPKVFTTKDMKTLGYVNTGATSQAKTSHLDSIKDDDWLRNDHHEKDKSTVNDTNGTDSVSPAASCITTNHSLLSNTVNINSDIKPSITSTATLREGEAFEQEKQKRRVHWDKADYTNCDSNHLHRDEPILEIKPNNDRTEVHISTPTSNLNHLTDNKVSEEAKLYGSSISESKLYSDTDLVSSDYKTQNNQEKNTSVNDANPSFLTSESKTQSWDDKDEINHVLTSSKDVFHLSGDKDLTEEVMGDKAEGSISGDVFTVPEVKNYKSEATEILSRFYRE